MRTARLLLPAVRWQQGTGFDRAWSEIERSLSLGIGGFIIFGGEAASVSELIREMRRHSAEPLLVASDLERGAGQQFRGATPLPPAAALAWLGDRDVVRRAGELTAREARAIGVDWLLAPVCDLDIEPRNPIVSTRSFGADPWSVAAFVSEWIAGARAVGALTCAKHFPGHGRTLEDSHLSLPVVGASAQALELDLIPFQAAVTSGVDSVMTAHVAFPGLDDGIPATRSTAILRILRSRLGFHGLVVSDALEMPAFASGTSEEEAAVQAVHAGCDVLLCPTDPLRVAERLDFAVERGVLESGRIEESLVRLDVARSRLTAAGVGPVGFEPTARPPSSEEPGPAVGLDEHQLWAREVARRCVHPVRGRPSKAAGAGEIQILGDLDGPASDDRLAEFRRALGARAPTGAPPIVAAVADVRAGRGRPGFSEQTREQLVRALADFPESTVILFGHPRLLSELGRARHVLCAWSSEPLMQQAAATWLSSGVNT